MQSFPLLIYECRGFSILNAFKTKARSQLNSDVTESILRLQFSEDTVHTLDVARLTRMWSDNGHTLCHEVLNSIL